jgi:hypothetical protein
MEIMKQCTKRLNLNIKPTTYRFIAKVASHENRKPGNLARLILDKWVDQNRQRKR